MVSAMSPTSHPYVACESHSLRDTPGGFLGRVAVMFMWVTCVWLGSF